MESDENPKTYRVRREIIYRVWTLTEVNMDSYGNAHTEAQDMDANVSLEDAAFLHELRQGEETVYSEIFDEEIQANGPDGVYSLIQLLEVDGEGNEKVVKQGYTENCGHAGDVRISKFDQDVEITELSK